MCSIVEGDESVELMDADEMEDVVEEDIATES